MDSSDGNRVARSLFARSLMVATTTAREGWRQVRPFGQLLREPRIAALRYQGSLPGPGYPVSMLYVGEAQRAPEFEILLGSDAERDVAPPEEVFRGRITSYVARRAGLHAMALETDIAIRELFPMEPLPGGSLLHHPFVDGFLEVTGGLPQQIRRVRSRSYRRLLRTVERRAEYHTEVTTATDALATFWRDLHVPYVQSRFGRRAAIDGLPTLTALFESHGRLLLVKKSNQVVAAAMLLHEFIGPEVLSYYRNGIRDCDSLSEAELTERTAALELALMRYAVEQRYAHIDLGFTRAIASDGRFIHKRRLGCTFSPLLGGPRFALTCKAAVRPALYSRFAILSGVGDSLALQLGYDDGTTERGAKHWRGVLKSYMAPGLRTIHLHVRASCSGPGRAAYEKALAEVAGEREVIVHEV